MRKVLFYGFCLSGMALFYFAVQTIIYSLSSDMAFGLGVGFLLGMGLAYIANRLDAADQRRSLD